VHSRPKKKKATRSDVARLAGVSESTVSYALTGVRSISDETRLRIQQAMDDLGYVPNAMAQALASKKSGLLAVHFPVGERGFNPSDFDYVEAATQAVAEEGYQLLLWPNAVEDTESFKKIFSRGLVEGVLLMEVRANDPRVNMLIEAQIPFCMIGRTDDAESLTYVDADFSQWGPMAMHHLSVLGHRVVGVISQANTFIETGYGPVIRTEENMATAAERLGITLIFKHVLPTIRAGRDGLEQLLTEHPDLTAVIGFNEPGMIGALEEAAVLGKEIPRDLSVIHFGISEEAATMTVPAQSTIGVVGKDLGRMAAKFLMARLDGDNLSVMQHLSAPMFTDRGSTAPARRG
jgi:DNA-binding LacI/PurR family transcriptional regulator